VKWQRPWLLEAVAQWKRQIQQLQQLPLTLVSLLQQFLWG
jgi:hypothetical protein